jgi:nucleoside-diphosphate-sugar epimerase
VLVTGGLGFIGSRLCNALLDAGAHVRCVDNLSGVYADGVGPAAAPGLASRGADVRVADVGPEHVDGMDAVIHLAGLPGVRTRHSAAELLRANVELSERLAVAAAARGAHLVFVSSSSVYGNARVLPTPEHAEPAPLNPYAESKLAAEAAVLRAGGDAGIVRPFTVYGPGQRPDMAFARWIGAMGRGEPAPLHAAPGAARDFTYVDDAVAGLVAALRHGRPGRAYNISGWRSVAVRSALELLGCPELRELPASDAEATVTWGSPVRASAELGYAPRVGLDAGIARQLEVASPRRLGRRRPRAPAA